MPIVVPEGDDRTAAIRRVRLLLNDVATEDADRTFSDNDLEDFLSLESWNVKLAAAQAIDTNATNEALASKVIRDHELTTDGAKLADAMRKHAAALRAQAADELDDSDDGFYFGVLSLGGSPGHAERTQYPCT